MNAVAAPVLAGHAFLRGMPPDDVALLAGTAVAISVPAGHRLFDEGAPAQNCWLLTDGPAVLALCERYPELGYQLATRMLAAAVRRLQATRLRLLDLYGAPGGRGDAG